MSREKSALRQLLKQKCNKTCADCTSRNPLWASTNLGIFLCIRCAGLHRKMGTHISKVKSVNLDTWRPNLVDNMRRNGNEVANKYWEYGKPRSRSKPTESDHVSLSEDFINTKYKYRSWVRPDDVKEESVVAESVVTEKKVLSRKKKLKKTEGVIVSKRNRKRQRQTSPPLQQETIQQQKPAKTKAGLLSFGVEKPKKKDPFFDMLNFDVDLSSSKAQPDVEVEYSKRKAAPKKKDSMDFLFEKKKRVPDIRKDKIMSLFNSISQSQAPVQQQPQQQQQRQGSNTTGLHPHIVQQQRAYATYQQRGAMTPGGTMVHPSIMQQYNQQQYQRPMQMPQYQYPQVQNQQMYGYMGYNQNNQRNMYHRK